LIPWVNIAAVCQQQVAAAKQLAMNLTSTVAKNMNCYGINLAILCLFFLFFPLHNVVHKRLYRKCYKANEMKEIHMGIGR
jgi:hypothetical protein